MPANLTLLVAALALTPFALTLSAQQPATTTPPPPTITTTSRLVVLDVVVNDRQGHVLTDLTRDEFHVTEAGDPQTLTNFEPAGSHLAPPDAIINSTADLDRLAPRAPVNIILLDEFNTKFEDEAFARYSLKKYLSRQPDKLNIPTILIAVSIDKFEVLHDYTEDKQAIIASLDHHFVANPWRNENMSWAAERLGTAFATLRRVAEASIGHLGHKNMIWIGRGFPPINFSNVAVDQQNRVETEVQRCVNVLRDARITMSTIDPAGVMTTSFAYTSTSEMYDPFGGNYAFSKLARATGGRTIYGRNDVDVQIDAAATDGSSFYTLVYRPTGSSNNPRQFRRIVVTVDRPNTVVTTRDGYYPSQRTQRVNPENPGRRLIADLVSAETGMAYDGVDFTVSPRSTPDTNYLIHIAGRSLGWTYATDTEPRKTEVILLVSTFDKKGKELKRVARNLTAKAPATVAPTGRLDRAIEVPYMLEADPKAVRARFVVRVASSGRIGTADMDLTSPAVVSSAANRPAQPNPAQSSPAQSSPAQQPTPKPAVSPAATPGAPTPPSQP